MANGYFPEKGFNPFKKFGMTELKYTGDDKYRIAKLRKINEKLNGSMQKISDVAGKLNDLMSRVSSSSLETNRAVENNMLALKKMDEFASRLIGCMAESRNNVSLIEKEVSGSISHIDEFEKMVQEASLKSDEESRIVSQMEKEARQIVCIVELVKNIADETNLLALNAAIEASKAGEYGRGFAVVAEEVRSLAEFSEKTTHQINEAIDETISQLNKVISGVRFFNNAVDLSRKKSAIITEKFGIISSAMLEGGSLIRSMVSGGESIKNESVTALREGEEIAGAVEEVTASGEETTQSTHEEFIAIENINEETGLLLSLLGDLENYGDEDGKSEKIRYHLDAISAALEEVSSSSFEIKMAVDEMENGAELISSSLKALQDNINRMEFGNIDSISGMKYMKSNIRRALDALEDVKVLDHILFVEELNRSIETNSAFSGQLDPEKCAFGLWYSSYVPKNEKESALFKAIKTPHDTIHRGAAKIVHLMGEDRVEESREIFNKEVLPACESMKEFFRGWGMKEGLMFIAAGVARSRQLNDFTLKYIIELENCFDKIRKVVGVIFNVTIQINMLAVNGAIEAARAGEFGRGFSVVAGDIRNMARESENNAAKIKDMLETASARVEELQRYTENIEVIIESQNEKAFAISEGMSGIVNLINRTESALSQAEQAQQDMAEGIGRVKSGNRVIQAELEKTLASIGPARHVIKQQTEGLEENLQTIITESVIMNEFNMN